MNEPRRLVAEGTEFERGVLRSARLDAPTDEAFKRTLLAIGAGAATLSTTAATAGAGVAAGGAAAGGGMTVLGGAGAGMLVKWVGIAVVVACAGTAVTDASLAPRHSAALHPAAVSKAEIFLVPAPSPLDPAPVVPDAPAPDRERPPAFEHTPVGPPTQVAGAPNGHAASVNQERSPRGESAFALSVKPRAPSSLQAQVAALDRVRALLAERNTARALEELDAYDHAFPSSDLGEEATVLRIDAVIDDGDAPGAVALARRLLLKSPASPHAAHLRQVLGAHNL